MLAAYSTPDLMPAGGICSTARYLQEVMQPEYSSHSPGTQQVSYLCSSHTDSVLLCTCNMDSVFTMQIMMMLTRDQARPEIPDSSTLPGPHWSGIGGFVDLIKVTSRAHIA